jgi:hypothetical protein
MNKVKFAALVMMSMTLTSVAALAGVWSATGAITSYEDYGVGPYIKIAGDTGANPGNCTLASQLLLLPAPSLTQPKRVALQRVLLSAHLAGRSVSVKISDECNEGYRTYYAVSAP